MTSQHPRTMADWIRIQERSNVSLRGMTWSVLSTIDQVKEEISVRQPTAPIELTYQTAFYLHLTNRTRVRFLLDFPDVTKATDGADIPVSSYELWGRDVTVSLLARTTSAVPGAAAPGVTLPGLAATPSAIAQDEANIRNFALLATSGTSAFRAEEFLPGTLWEFKARAIGANTTTPGVFSETITVQMDKDETPPPQPTAPVVTAARGVLTVTWDGQSVLGPMPADFKYAVLAHGTASSPTFEIARFGRDGGFTIVADVDYYDPQFFRLQGVDESGNRGPWSEQGVGYTTPLVDTDVFLSTIDGAVTHLKNIDAGVSILKDTIITEHLVVTEDMTARLAQFLHVKAGMLETNEIWADEGWFGLADAKLFRGDAFVGRTFEGGTFTATEGGKFQTNVEDLAGIKLAESGLDAWNDAGINTFSINASTGAVLGTGTFRTGHSGNHIEMSGGPSGATMKLYTGTGSGRGSIWARSPETGEQRMSLAFGDVENPSGTLPVVVVTPTRAYMNYGSRTVQVWNNAGVEELLLDATGAAVVLRGNLDMREGRTTYRYGSAAELAYVGQRPEAGSSPDFEIRALEGGIRLVGVLQSLTTFNFTTTSGANMFVAGNGEIMRSTSASRYKLDQQLMDVPDAALDVRMKDWLDKGEVERSKAFESEPHPLTEDRTRDFDALNLERVPGMVAEDLVARGLERFVIYGPDGQTEGIMYDRFALARTEVLKRQLDDALERIYQLESHA